MLARRLPGPQSVLSPRGTAARFPTLQPTCRTKSTRGAPGESDLPSLYKQLFPDAVPVKRARPRSRHGKPATQKPLRSALIRDLRAWGWEGKSRSEAKGEDAQSSTWGGKYIRVREGQRTQLGDPSPDLESNPLGARSLDPSKATDDPQSYNGPAVLILNSASKSLLESDFYRLGRQGQHLDGWTSGIVKVLQTRSPTTHTPIGQYHIHFDTRAAALSYMDTVMRLQSLSRKAAGPNWDSSSPRDPTGPLPLAPKLGATPGGAGDTDATLRGFTLVPPSAALDLRLKKAPLEEEVRGWRRRDALGGGGGAGVEDRSEHHRVLVWLDGSPVTPETLLAAIDEDGKERNLEWRLQDEARAVTPVGSAAPGLGSSNGFEEGPSEREEDGGLAQGRHARFVVSFVEPVEARRFVRCWHKREMSLPGRERTVMVNATALW